MFLPKWIKNLGSHWNLFMNIYSSSVHSHTNWNLPQVPFSGEWLDKGWYIHTVEYYTVLKRNKLLMHTTTWMDLESCVVMLSENSYSPNPYLFHLYNILEMAKLWRWTMEIFRAKGWGKEYLTPQGLIWGNFLGWQLLCILIVVMATLISVC